MGHGKHRLTNIDPERRRGDCAECGPDAPIRRRTASDTRPIAAVWRCRPPSDRKRHTPAGRARAKLRARIRAYGISPEEFNDMMERQGNLCAICRRPPGRQRLHIDHCHTSGKVRALLCNGCNTGLGLFGDDPEVMLRAIAYLREHGERSAPESI